MCLSLGMLVISRRRTTNSRVAMQLIIRSLFLFYAAFHLSITCMEVCSAPSPGTTFPGPCCPQGRLCVMPSWELRLPTVRSFGGVRGGETYLSSWCLSRVSWRATMTEHLLGWHYGSGQKMRQERDGEQSIVRR